MEMFGTGNLFFSDFSGIFLDPFVDFALLVMAGASALAAWEKGRNPVLWFICGLVAGPVALAFLTFETTHHGPSPPWTVND